MVQATHGDFCVHQVSESNLDHFSPYHLQFWLRAIERSANYCEADIKADHMSHRRSICLIILTNLVGALAGWGELHNRGAGVDLANFGYIAFAMLAMTILADAVFVMNLSPRGSFERNRRLTIELD
jgi:hypothetical protein